MQRLPSALLLCSFLSIGCGGDELPVRPVSGIVKLKDGTPVAHANIRFYHDTLRGATGQTDENGKYTLSTLEQGDGAAIGTHKVTVQPIWGYGMELTPADQPMLDKMKKDFTDFSSATFMRETTELTIEVSDDNEDYDIVVE